MPRISTVHQINVTGSRPARWVLRRLLVTALAMASLSGRATQAATYTWQVTSNKNWNNAGNWVGGVTPVTVAGDIIDASTIDLTAAATFNLDNGTTTNNRTVGTLIFGDTNVSNSTTYNWTVAANGPAGSNPLLILDGGGTTPVIQINNGTTTITAAISGTQGFIKTGAGTLALSNAGNLITGGINLNAGALSFTTGSLNNNVITVTGNTTLTWATAGDFTDLSSKIVLGNGFTLTLGLNGGATDNTIFASTIATSGGNGGGIVKSNGGILTITAQQIYTGGTRVNNGRLVLTGGDDRLAPAGAITFGNGANSGVIQLGDGTGASNQTISGVTISGTGSANAFVGGNSAISVLTINNASNIAAASSPLLGGTGANENNLALVKSGAGSLSLSKSNTFTGDVTLIGGNLTVTNNSSLGVGPKTVTISGTVNAPSLQLSNTSGLALAAGIDLITSNDNATAPAILNVAGNNSIGGNITLADGGFGTGQTRIKVNAGSLTLSGAITASATAGSNRTLTLDGAGNGTASGVISDNGAIKVGVIKLGTGTWTLSGANTYSGDTTVSAGRLNITTAQAGAGAITVADGATLGITLTSSGQTLAPSSLTLSHVTVGTALSFDLGSANNPAVPLISTGSFTTTGVGANVIDIAGTGLSVGTFDLIDYTGSIGGAGFAGLALGATPARVTANLVDTVGKVQLAITAFDIPKWTGAISGDWDVNDEADPTIGIGTVNWKEANSGKATRYLQFGSTVDSVLFDDTATGTTTVNLTTSLSPNSVTVNNSVLTYTFTGVGKLTGATILLKTGTGTLILANNGGNDYTGLTTITGGTLQIGDGVSFDAGQIGSGNVLIGAAGTLAFDRPGGAGQDATFSNIISGAGTLVQRGGNSITLSGNSSGFDGAIQVLSGTLKVGSSNALGSTVGGTSVSAGATLDISGFTIAESIVLNGATLLQLSGTSVLTGNVAIAGGSIIDSQAGTLTVSGNITGSGGLTKNDAGNLVLSGSNSFTGAFVSNGGTVTLSGLNVFDGGLFVNGGTVILSANQAYTGGTTVTQGTLQIGGGNTATVGNIGSGDIALNAGDSQTATLNILRGDNALIIANKITSSGTGTNAITIGATGTASASGVVTFSGVNTFAGNVTINGGALKITNSSALGIGPKTVNVQANSRPALLLDGTIGNIVLAAGINFNLSSDGATGSEANNPGGIVNLAGNNTINGNIAITNGGGGNGKIVVNGGTLNLTGTIDATGATGVRSLLLGGSGNGTITGTVADWFDSVAGANRVVSISKDGAGTWALSGLNTYTGTVAVTEGTLSVNYIDSVVTNAQPLGEGTGAITLGTATTSGTLEYTGGTAAVLNRAITVNGVGGGIVKNSSGQLLTLAGVLTKNARPLTLLGGSFNVTGQVTGTSANSDLIIDGSTVTLSNATNNYNGATRVIDGGILKNGLDNAVPSTSSTVVLGEATNNTSGTYDLNGFNQTLTALTTAGSGVHIVTNSAASGTSTLTHTGTSVFDGVIKDGATASIAVTKSTGGAFTLGGVDTYSGATTITGGALIVSGSLNGTASVAVQSGTLGGAGSIATGSNGNVTVSSGGILAPGNSGAGTLALSLGVGVLDLSGAVGSSGWLKFELGVTSDEIALDSGTLNIGTGLQLSDFSFTDAGGFGLGTYVLFNTSTPITGSLGTNISGTILGYQATLEFADGGNDLVLNVVPEPGAGISLIGGINTLLGWQRLRRRSRRATSN